MTNIDIVAMALEAGLAPICEGCDVPDVSYAYESWDVELKAFAELVRADERERIFQELLRMHENTKGAHNYFLHAVGTIRARSNT